MSQRTLLYTEALSSSCSIIELMKSSGQYYDSAAIIQSLIASSGHIMICARGSSLHAAAFGKCLIETELGIPCGFVEPSAITCYKAKPFHSSTLLIVISQSGASPDSLAVIKAAKAQGAKVLAITNTLNSPVDREADETLYLHVGPEKSIAATKTFIGTLVIFLQLIAVLKKDEALASGLARLPDFLDKAWELDWKSAIPALQGVTNLIVLGRGFCLPIAAEAALKLKEVCHVHAEAFSTAEVKHGPMTLIKDGFPVWFFGQSDETLQGSLTLIDEFVTRGSKAFAVTEGQTQALPLPVVPYVLPVLQPVLFIHRFYRFINDLALAKGIDSDNPPYLQKVTKTN